MINKYLYVLCFAFFLASCSTNGIIVSEESDEVFDVDDSYSPYEWHRTFHGPDRFFYRRDQFILEP